MNRINRQGTEVFWGEIAPCEHMLQIYAEDDTCLDALEGFVVGGLGAGDGVVVIATPSHLSALESRINAKGFDLSSARMRDQYIELDAEETLSKFVVDGWPDEELFNQVVNGIITRAKGRRRKVRAFGEMVALLWAQGHQGGTVRLEHLWHKFCQREMLSLFCAYPKSGFTRDADESVREICAAHSKVIGDSRNDSWNPT